MLLNPPYRDVMARPTQPAQRRIDAAVAEALSSLLPADLGEQPHLVRAVIAERIAGAASRCRAPRSWLRAIRTTQDGTTSPTRSASAVKQPTSASAPDPTASTLATSSDPGRRRTRGGDGRMATRIDVCRGRSSLSPRELSSTEACVSIRWNMGLTVKGN